MCCSIDGLEDQIQTLKLDWELAQIASSEEETSSESNSSSRARAQAELFEWETQAFGEAEEEADRADLIIGADIVRSLSLSSFWRKKLKNFLFFSFPHQVYDPSLTSPLAATIYWLLSRSTSRKSQAIIAGTIRNESTWESFLNQCRKFSLQILFLSKKFHLID